MMRRGMEKNWLFNLWGTNPKKKKPDESGLGV
jgi:hypothetical protein